MPIIRERITVLQIKARFQQPGAGGIIDLKRRDFTRVNMQDPAIKDGFTKVAKLMVEERDNPPFLIDMSDSDISGTDMREYNLTGVIMNRVIAERTLFTRSIFSDTYLEEADLRNADFRLADLQYTKLYEARIEGANFASAKLTSTRGLGSLETAAQRLSVTSSIHQAELPELLETYRDSIEEAINKHHPEEESAAQIQYDDPQKESRFFGSSWLTRNNKKDET